MGFRQDIRRENEELEMQELIDDERYYKRTGEFPLKFLKRRKELVRLANLVKEFVRELESCGNGLKTYSEKRKSLQKCNQKDQQTPQ